MFTILLIAALLQLPTPKWRQREGLSRPSHDLLVELMSKTETGARRIKSVVPAGAIVTHKTGTMPGTVNDVAVITSPDRKHHVVVAIFTKSRKSAEKLAEDDVAAIARKVYQELTRE